MANSAPLYDIAIFGGAGYIGTALSRRLIQEKKSVVSISRGIKETETGVVPLQLDLGDEKELAKQRWKAKSFFILVGQQHSGFDSEVEKSILAGITQFINNQDIPAKVFYTSSALVYGNCVQSAQEKDPLSPVEPYSHFKAEAETYLRKNLDPRHTLGILRLSNVFGGAKNRGFVGIVLSAALAKNPALLSINGEGEQTRDYIYLPDVVRAFCAVEQQLSENDTINIAFGESLTLLRVVEIVAQVTNREIPFVLTHQPLAEVQVSIISSKKLKQKYGCMLEHTFEAGIKDFLKR